MLWKVRQADDREAAREFIRTYHYSHKCKANSTPYGLYVGRTLAGAMTFGMPVQERPRSQVFGEAYKQHVIEMTRMALSPALPKCTASQFISLALKALKEDRPDIWAVLSYADNSVGHFGIIYQATNAIYFGRTGETNLYLDADGAVHSSIRGAGVIRLDDAARLGYTHYLRSYRHRYLYLLAKDRRERHYLENLLRLKPQPYPKEETQTI